LASWLTSNDRLSDARHLLVPVGQGLLVDRANPRETAVVEIADEGPGNEAAGAGDDDQVVAPVGQTSIGVSLFP
jgi:hypothetical protein